jgi:hypothetical protein
MEAVPWCDVKLNRSVPQDKGLLIDKGHDTYAPWFLRDIPAMSQSMSDPNNP